MKAKSEKLQSEHAEVDMFIAKLKPEIQAMVECLRQAILETGEGVGERIKWNHPSFFYTGPMQPFNPKEYKREIAVFNLFKNRVMLVFPSGKKLSDAGGFFQSIYPDGRATVIFKDFAEVEQKKSILQSLVSQWLGMVEQS